MVETYSNVGKGRCVAFSCAAPIEGRRSEDAYAVISLSDTTAVLVIADGAGGYTNGAEASSLLIAQLKKHLQRAKDYSELRPAILDAIEATNKKLLNKASKSATTAIIVELQGKRCRHYLVGDSSAMLTGQRGAIRFQSVAQSLVGYGVEAGLLDDSAALEHDERHIVLNLIGMPDMKIEVGSFTTMQANDTLLLCSDGLTDNIAVHDIIDAIRIGEPEKAIQALAENCLQAMQTKTGHPDDLSILLFRLNK